jgi:hypothetical protein
MRSLLFLIGFSFTMAAQLFAQRAGVRISQTPIGTSAISINTIVAKTLSFNYPIYDYKADTLDNYLFVTGRQKDESSGNYLRMASCIAINSKKDSVQWYNEAGFYDITVANKNLLVSNDHRTVRFNKRIGFDELRYDSRIFYTLTDFNKGFMYGRDSSDVLNCVNLATGLASWTCSIPRKADWVDVQKLNDTVLLIAADGLHAIHPMKGLLWSVPLTTAERTNRSLVYSRAKYLTIQKISKVYRTSLEDNMVTQLASNIVKDDKRIYFASREKLIAVTYDGKIVWQVSLKNYPVSKMLLTKTDSSLILTNFGLATHSHNFITWGKPFVITIDPINGHIHDQYDLSHIENLADFIQTDKSLIFAGRDNIMEAIPGHPKLNSVLELNKNKFGQFVDFVNGDEYYTFLEGYYVPLNFINDKLIYFRADNNKVFGIDGEEFKYEYHFTELFRLDKKYDNKTILVSENKTLITSNNFELLFTIDLSLPNVIVKNKMYFIDKMRTHVIDLDELK